MNKAEKKEAQIEKLKRVIPKFRANKKISRRYVEKLEWELKFLEADQENKKLRKLLKKHHDIRLAIDKDYSANNSLRIRTEQALQEKEEIICPICGLDGFEDQADLDIHLEDCEE